MPRGRKSKTGRRELGGANPKESYQQGVETIRKSPAIRLGWAAKKDKLHPRSFLYLRTDTACPGYVRLGVSKSPTSRLDYLIRQLHPSQRGNHKLVRVLLTSNAYTAEQLCLIHFDRRIERGDWIKATPAEVAKFIEAQTGEVMVRPDRAALPSGYEAFRREKRQAQKAARDAKKRRGVK